MNLGEIAAFLSSVTWAIGVSAYTNLSKKYEPSTINFSRALVALTGFLLLGISGVSSEYSGLAFLQNQISIATSHHFFWLSLSIFSSYAFGDVLLLHSVKILGLPAALAIASSYPIWAALYGAVFKSQSMHSFRWVGLILTCVGTSIVILSGVKERTRFQDSSSKNKYIFGVFLALFTSVFWSLNSVSAAEGGFGLDPFFSNTIRMSLALILCPFFGFLMTRNTTLLVSKFDFKKNIFIFILEGIGGSYLFLYAFSHSQISTASALSSLAPVISVPIAWIMKWEKVQILKTLGILLVVIGIFLLMGVYH